ncbi:MAG: alpha/beta fold hydrolase [Vicingus serpentipes]|nr:alpha/beta fold hydrolase [Vicingus serpentipes]
MKKLFFILLISCSTILLYNCGDSSQNSTEEAVIEITEETANINGVDHFIQKMGSGEPLLVLHGGPGLFHDYLVPHFKKLAADYQVIFYDQRGCGKTAFPTDTATISMSNYVEDVEGIRKHLKLEKVILLGHSFGAILAVNYAKKYSPNISKLILVSPGPATSQFYDQAFNNMQSKRKSEDTKALIEAMMSDGFSKRESATFKKTILLGDKVNLANQEKIEELYAPMNFDNNNAQNMLLVNSIMEKNFFDYDLTEGIETVTPPTMVIIGDLDNVPFASAQLIVENIKGAKLEVIKKTCHYPFYEDPKEFNRIVTDFLNPEYQY